MSQKVSIVIIGRNEEKSIGECLNAAQIAAEQIGGAEIIFVDSASTDKTVSTVQSFDVKIISLKPEIKLCPSLGRFVGSFYATGDFILFLDADTLVYKDFLPVALEHFEKNPNVGGINGYLDDLNEKGELLTDVEERFENVTEVKWLRGPCCFYRRETLQKVGSFNPDLAVEEEAELGLRLVKNDWKLKIIPVPMACHTRCFHLQTTRNLFSAFKRDYIVGRLGEVTKTLAYCFKEGNGLAFCWLRLKTTVLFIGWLLISLLCFFLPSFLYPQIIFPLILILGLLAIFSKKRSIKQTFVFVPSKILCFVDILAGLHKIRISNSHHYSAANLVDKLS